MAGAGDSDSTSKQRSGPLAELGRRWDNEQFRDAILGFAAVLVSFFGGLLFGTYLAFSDPQAAGWLLSGWYVYLIAIVSVVFGTAIVLGYRYWESAQK